jgi:hypothetical protein
MDDGFAMLQWLMVVDGEWRAAVFLPIFLLERSVAALESGRDQEYINICPFVLLLLHFV